MMLNVRRLDKIVAQNRQDMEAMGLTNCADDERMPSLKH